MGWSGSPTCPVDTSSPGAAGVLPPVDGVVWACPVVGGVAGPGCSVGGGLEPAQYQPPASTATRTSSPPSRRVKRGRFMYLPFPCCAGILPASSRNPPCSPLVRDPQATLPHGPALH